jgi:hypothetical protein
MTPRRDFLALAAGAVGAGTVLPVGGVANARWPSPSYGPTPKVPVEAPPPKEGPAPRTPASPDAELIRLCGEFERMGVDCQKVEDSDLFEGNPMTEAAVWDRCDRELWQPYRDLGRRISKLRPVSPDGVHAKASATRSNLALDLLERTDLAEALSWSLVNDVLAMGAAGA